MFGILADDLTGALDGGVQLRKKGIPTAVLFGDRIESITSGSRGAIIIDTESRNCGPALAGKKISKALQLLSNAGIELAYKKIDSTLRGNLGPEIAVLFDAGTCDRLLLCPALPAFGRTVRQGQLLVHGVPLDETEFSIDPLAPVSSASLIEIISYQTGGKVPKERLIVPDVNSDADLLKIARSLMDENSRILPCGSAGLLQYLRTESIVDLRPAELRDGGLKSLAKSASPVLIVSSSLSEITRAQLRLFAEQNPETVAIVRPDHRLLNLSARSETERCVLSADRSLSLGKHVIIDSAGDREEISSESDQAAEESRLIQNFITEAVSGLMERRDRGATAGIMAAGGETAMSVCTGLAAQGIDIIQEVEPFVPAGTIRGGPMNGMPLVTKAGGFGSEGVFTRGCEFLSGFKLESLNKD
ncbi:MAG: four-carbon acid sugar kinase family protein [Spirochaetales bacterium]|jgi:D-threonate/D-erythronate kinase|nr:four-carbon acid sugar kinase family protein [Spirochaetales bacterium]